jgi:hypothetical protein
MPDDRDGGGTPPIRGFFDRRDPSINRHGVDDETIVILFNCDFGGFLK